MMDSFVNMNFAFNAIRPLLAAEVESTPKRIAVRRQRSGRTYNDLSRSAC